MYNRESFELFATSLASALFPLHFSYSTYKSSLGSCRHPCAQDPSPNSFAYHSYAKTPGVGVVSNLSTPQLQILRCSALVHFSYISEFAYLHSFQLIPRCTFKTPGWGSRANDPGFANPAVTDLQLVPHRYWFNTVQTFPIPLVTLFKIAGREDAFSAAFRGEKH